MAASDLWQASRPLPWLDPLEATRRLRAAGLRPLLLHSAGAHPEARSSLIGLSPLVDVRVAEGTLTESWADGSIEVSDTPLASLRAILDRFRFTTKQPGFTGGWVGVAGFGFARILEPSLPAGAPSELPDLALRLCRDAVVLDVHARAATAWAGAPDGDTDAAQERLEQIVAAWARPAPPPSPARLTGPWTASMEQPAFESAVREVKRLIHHGDLFQANLATRFAAPFEGDTLTLVARLAAANPSPYMAWLGGIL